MKYKIWAEKQDKEFIREVHGDNDIPLQFKDSKANKEISLVELEMLDNQYITNPED